MNGNASCHEISDCPGLFVDAFRSSKYLQRLDVCLILSHYHGDHYGNLPIGHQGTSIHCTPITARLLREIHQIKSQYVVEHEYGATWTYVDKKKHTAKITFLDAHHCPGAALILIDLPDVGKLHLHCGDMRFHPQMLQYPQLCSRERRLDIVWLDTTYALATRKLSLPTQEQAISETVEQVQSVLREDSGGEVMVLICCYNIGKEKILWRLASSNETRIKLYANERKMRMLKLVESLSTSDKDKSSFTKEFCTPDPTATNIHVVPMHLAGKMWPFFQPNYQACAKYALENSPDPNPDGEQSTSSCFFKKVVVFCPTGWAAANNWNRKNNVHVCAKTKVPDSLKGETIHVEIRLLPYSEHSSLSELQTLVNECWKPRCVVPTVYRTEAERRQIIKLFTVDQNRAKEHFFQTMKAKPIAKADNAAQSINPRVTTVAKARAKETDQPIISLVEDECDSSTEEIESERRTPSPSSQSTPGDEGNNLKQLVEMGFSLSAVKFALSEAQQFQGEHVMDAALNILLSSRSAKEAPSGALAMDKKKTRKMNATTQQATDKKRTKKTQTPSPQSTRTKRKKTQQTSLDLFLMSSPPSGK